MNSFATSNPEMTIHHNIEELLSKNGFAIIENVFTNEMIETVMEKISHADTAKPTFRKSADLFAIRQFLKEIPGLQQLIFNQKLSNIIFELFGKDYFIVKSIYFDKPAQSNWFVGYHQDLTISVADKKETEGFSSWTRKQNQFSVQPPLKILENNFTIRIHLDNTDETNGALKVIPGSHLKGIYRAEIIDRTTEKEVICNIQKGGIMIMKPLLMHASDKTTSNRKRRVIHIEFSNSTLPDSLNWSERS